MFEQESTQGWRGLCIRLLAIVALGAAVGVVAASTASGSRDLTEHSRFPLWRFVPTERFSSLAEGYLGGTQWGTYVYSAGKHERNRACLTLAKITEYGLAGNAGDCADVTGTVNRIPAEALIGAAYKEEVGGPIFEEGFLGMLLPRSVVRVRLDIGSGIQLVKRTQYLGKRRQKKAGVPALRYLAFAVHRNLCIDGITGYSSTGRKVLDQRREECVGG
jgi:hypothetical protein